MSRSELDGGVWEEGSIPRGGGTLNAEQRNRLNSGKAAAAFSIRYRVLQMLNAVQLHSPGLPARAGCSGHWNTLSLLVSGCFFLGAHLCPSAWKKW